MLPICCHRLQAQSRQRQLGMRIVATALHAEDHMVIRVLA
jgi:hypothetical protein